VICKVQSLIYFRHKDGEFYISVPDFFEWHILEIVVFMDFANAPVLDNALVGKLFCQTVRLLVLLLAFGQLDCLPLLFLRHVVVVLLIRYIMKFPDHISGDVNNRATILNAERDILKTNAFIKQHENTLKGIFANVEKQLFNDGVQVEIKKRELAKISTQIVNFLEQQGLMRQLKDIRSFEQTINATLSENLESMDDFTQSIWTLLWTLISKR